MNQSVFDKIPPGALVGVALGVVAILMVLLVVGAYWLGVQWISRPSR